MAEMVSGKVMQANATDNSLTITTQDGSEKTIWTNEKTTWDGAASLTETEGKQVTVDVTADPADSSKWWANSVKVNQEPA